MSILDTINTINNSHMATTPTTGTSTTAAAATGVGSLNQNDFLKLMTTQLTTQDPFNPVDNTQMVAQMAQFSQVAGISQMNQSLQTIAASLGGNRLSDAASWIGHSMLVTSDIATPLRDGSYAGQFTLTGPADSVNVNFVDGNGAVVHNETLGAEAAGDMSFAWDGKDASGATVATGPLRVVVTATHAGQTTNAATAAWTAIGGIQSPSSGGDSRLVTGLGLLAPSDAIRLA